MTYICQGCKKLRKVFDVYISVSEKFDKCIDCFRDEYPAPDDDGKQEGGGAHPDIKKIVETSDLM